MVSGTRITSSELLPSKLTYQGHPTRKFYQNTWNICFCFLWLFQSFVKAYVCKQIQVHLFRVFGWKFKLQKILGIRIHCKRHICPSENKERILHGAAKIWILFSSGKILVFTTRKWNSYLQAAVLFSFYYIDEYFRTNNNEKAENDVINTLPSEDMENTLLESRM